MEEAGEVVPEDEKKETKNPGIASRIWNAATRAVASKAVASKAASKSVTIQTPEKKAPSEDDTKSEDLETPDKDEENVNLKTPGGKNEDLDGRVDQLGIRQLDLNLPIPVSAPPRRSTRNTPRKIHNVPDFK